MTRGFKNLSGYRAITVVLCDAVGGKALNEGHLRDRSPAAPSLDCDGNRLGGELQIDAAWAAQHSGKIEDRIDVTTMNLGDVGD